MASFSVLTKDAPADLVLVREGFTFTAFLIGPIWFAWNRAWLGAVLTVTGILSLVAVFVAVSASLGYLIAAVGAFMFLIALEAPVFLRRALVRRGFQIVDFIECPTANEAEIRFLARRLSSHEAGRASIAQSRLPVRRTESVGLFFNGS